MSSKHSLVPAGDHGGEIDSGAIRRRHLKALGSLLLAPIDNRSQSLLNRLVPRKADGCTRA
jgi:hypothetical protein